MKGERNEVSKWICLEELIFCSLASLKHIFTIQLEFAINSRSVQSNKAYKFKFEKESKADYLFMSPLTK